jgi:hypothetical protein
MGNSGGSACELWMGKFVTAIVRPRHPAPGVSLFVQQSNHGGKLKELIVPIEEMARFSLQFVFHAFTEISLLLIRVINSFDFRS